MKRKHKRTSIEALLAVNSAPVPKYTGPQGRQNLKSWTEEFNRNAAEEKQREQELADAPFKKLADEHQDLLRQLQAQKAAALFTAPSEELAERCPVAEESEFLKDDGTAFDVETLRAMLRDAFAEAQLALESDEGLRLESSGLEKLQRISVLNTSISWLQARSWVELVHYLDELGALSTTDVSRREVQPEPVDREIPLESVEDVDSAIERLDTTTREGQKQAHILLAGKVFRGDAKKVFQSWLSSLSNNFDFIPDEAQQRAAIDVFTERNLSFMSKPSYDIVRKLLVNRGIFPERCYTDEDRAELLVEASDTRSYTGRQELKSKLALLNRG